MPESQRATAVLRAAAKVSVDLRGRSELRNVNKTVPVVFPIVVDPVGAGFVDSLARPYILPNKKPDLARGAK
jgi:hypothetical protein